MVSVFYVVCSVQCAVCSVQCEVCRVQCAMCSVHCAMCSVQCTYFSMQCAVQCAAVPSCKVLGKVATTNPRLSRPRLLQEKPEKRNRCKGGRQQLVHSLYTCVMALFIDGGSHQLLASQICHYFDMNWNQSGWLVWHSELKEKGKSPQCTLQINSRKSEQR